MSTRALGPLVAPRMLAVGLVLLAGCAGGQRIDGFRQRVDAATLDLEAEPAVEARIARAEAALARESGLSPIDGIELRSRGLSVASVEEGEGVEFSARVRLENPWEMAAEHAAREAATDEALAEVEETALEARGARCREATSAAAAAERRALYGAYAKRLRAALAWNEERRAAGTVDELEAMEVELEGTLRLSTREPGPQGGEPSSRHPLPRLLCPPRVLDLGRELILSQIRAHHPAIDERRAASRRYEALSERARRRQLPWIGFLEVSYELAEDNSADLVAGQVAIEIPLGFGERAEAARYEALERSEDLEAEAVALEHFRAAEVALRQLQLFEDNVSTLAGLEGGAARAEATASRWLEARMGDPGRVSDLLDEALAARSAVVAARERAGLAACVLLEVTGVAAEDWPRGRER